MIRPCASAASIIATPIRSLTDQSGLKLSSLATTVALQPLVTRLHAHERRIADRLRHVIIDSPTPDTRFGCRHDSLSHKPTPGIPVTPTQNPTRTRRLPKPLCTLVDHNSREDFHRQPDIAFMTPAERLQRNANGRSVNPAAAPLILLTAAT